MKNRLVQLLAAGLMFTVIIGCGGPAAAAIVVDFHPALIANPTFSPTSLAGQGLQPSSPTAATVPVSEGLPNQVFLPVIQSAAPTSSFCPAIQHGLTFLITRYNPALGLLNESPVVAPQRYWLTNDNALAAIAFARLGQAEMSAVLMQSIQGYGSNTNGLIEVVWGVLVTFPPYDADSVLIKSIGEDEIWQELHMSGELLNDWTDYANLGLLGALNDFHQGNLSEALSVYAATLEQFDGTGFADKSFLSRADGRYETYKLALALYVGATIQAPNSNRGQMFGTLLAMQDINHGGFITHYYDPQTPDSEADANTETSALALLALEASGCGP